MSVRVDPLELATRFQQSVADVQSSAWSWVDRLRKGNLGQCRGLEGVFFDTLTTATDRFRDNPQEHYAGKNLEIALHAIRLFGVAWEPSLLQARGFPALSTAWDAALGAERPSIADGALRALTHLAPLLTHEQNVALACPESACSSVGALRSEGDMWGELLRASPVQLLIRDGYYQANEQAAQALRSASVILGKLRDILSDAGAGEGWNAMQLLAAARLSVRTVCLIIPELGRGSEGAVSDDTNRAIGELVDTLTWFITATGRMDAVKQGIVSTGGPIITQAAYAYRFNELQDISWLALALILKHGQPWANEFADTTARLTAKALERIESDAQSMSRRSGRFPLEVFLAVAGGGSGGFSVEEVIATAEGYLEWFLASSSCPPYYPDGLAAAALAWLESMQAGGEDRALASAVYGALEGRAFDADAQALLMRAAR